MTDTIVIGCDHGGLELKEQVKQYLEEKGLNIIDCGTHTTDSVDYPDFAQLVVDRILDNTVKQGILVCGTGIGISMKANRNKGIRAAVVHDTFTAEMAKAHNNANILCLGGRTTAPETACQLVDTWLNTDFEGDRHQRRLDKLDI